MKRNRKLAVSLIAVWVIVFLSLCLLDHFVLRFPEEKRSILEPNHHSERRLIPPTLGMVKRLSGKVNIQELFDILGAPNYDSTMFSTNQETWDLQFGYTATFIWWEGKVELLRVSGPFTSTRWLTFHIFMISLAVVEFCVYIIVRRYWIINISQSLKQK